MVLTTSAAILDRAGANISASVSGAMLIRITSSAIAIVNNITRINYSDTYDTLNDDVKWTLDEVASNIGAIYAITYDMSAIVASSSLIEAEDRITVLRDAALRGLSILRDKKTTTFIDGA